jgi:ubiquitin C-terminal hydrolase
MSKIALNIESVQQKKSDRVIKTLGVRQLIQSEFSPVMEHDSHEFLLYFLNKLKDELTEKNSKFNGSVDIDTMELWKMYLKVYGSIVD